jgi:hypothetical protein
VRAGSLDENIPAQDLFLTKAHTLFLQGVLIPVGHLMNGKTIFFDQRDNSELEYFHVEFDAHDVIDAEGALCESLRDEALKPCAPILGFNGGRSQIYSHLRSALSPIVDLRRPWIS